MNKQINELWWKARIGYNNQSCDNEVIEKFAELIVKQCCFEVVHESTLNQNVPEEFVINVIKRIEKHFGVE